MSTSTSSKQTCGYFLLKSEPTTFSIQDLQNSPEQTTAWDGVRNYQARNILRDDMQQGDWVLLYHSSCARPGVVGVGRVKKTAYPDPSQFNPQSDYFDPKATVAKPRWVAVDIVWHATFAQIVDREQLRSHPLTCGMLVLRTGNRLSVMPVLPDEFATVLLLAGYTDKLQ